MVSSRFVRVINRKWNLLPRMVAKVAPWSNPFPAHESDELVKQFDTIEKRERLLDVFEQMGRDRGFMKRTAAMARERLNQIPTLILFGQFDPMRVVGGVRR